MYLLMTLYTKTPSGLVNHSPTLQYGQVRTTIHDVREVGCYRVMTRNIELVDTHRQQVASKSTTELHTDHFCNSVQKSERSAGQTWSMCTSVLTGLTITQPH